MAKPAELIEGSMTVLQPRRGQAITIRLSEGVHESLRALAEANERSLSGEIRWVLKSYSNYPAAFDDQ